MSNASEATTTVADMSPYMDNDIENQAEPQAHFVIANMEEAQEKYREGLDFQSEGFFREAYDVYQRLINGINNLLNDMENSLSDEEQVNLQSMVGVLSDTCFALQSALRMDAEGSQFGGALSQMLNERLQRAYSVLSWQVRFLLPVQFIALPLAVAVIFLSANADCYSSLVIVAASLYVPIGLYQVLLGVLLARRLKEIHYDFSNLDRRHETAHPPGTFGFKIESFISIFFLFRMIWFIFALVSMFKEIDSCADDEVGERTYKVFVSFVVLSSLDWWFVLLIIASIPFVCLVICCFLVRYYRQQQKLKPVGMTKDNLKRLDSMSFHDGMFDENRDTCAICLCEFEQSDRVRVLPCSGKHAFHKDCIDKWLRQNDSCPQCREHLIDIVTKADV